MERKEKGKKRIEINQDEREQTREIIRMNLMEYNAAFMLSTNCVETDINAVTFLTKIIN